MSFAACLPQLLTFIGLLFLLFLKALVKIKIAHARVNQVKPYKDDGSLTLGEGVEATLNGVKGRYLREYGMEVCEFEGLVDSVLADYHLMPRAPVAMPENLGPMPPLVERGLIAQHIQEEDR